MLGETGLPGEDSSVRKALRQQPGTTPQSRLKRAHGEYEERLRKPIYDVLNALVDTLCEKIAALGAYTVDVPLQTLECLEREIKPEFIEAVRCLLKETEPSASIEYLPETGIVRLTCDPAKLAD